MNRTREEFTYDAPFGPLRIVVDYERLPRCTVTSLQPVPDGYALGDPNRQSGWGATYFYADEDKVCRSCGSRFVFAAKEKKYWAEVLRFDSGSTAIRCKSCRKAIRELKAKQRDYESAVAACKTTKATSADWLALAENSVILGEQLGWQVFEQALAAARKARRLGAPVADCWWFEARAQTGLGRLEKARAAYERFRQSSKGRSTHERERLRAAELLGPTPSDADQALKTALFERVIEAPAADAPREVYADFLLEHGDLRGEFISLQLKEAKGRASAVDRQRAADLLAANLKGWLGPLAELIEPSSARFQRGFLDSCRVVVPRRSMIGARFDDSRWATVRSLDTQEQLLIVSPALRMLEEATADLSALSILAKGGREVPLRRVLGSLSAGARIGPSIDDVSAWSDTFARGGLVHLDALSVSTELADPELGPLSRSALGSQLIDLDVASRRLGLRFARALETVAQLRTLERVSFRQINQLDWRNQHGAQIDCEFTRSRGGSWEALVRASSDTALIATTLRQSLEQLSPAFRRKVTLEVPTKNVGGMSRVVAVLREVFRSVTVTKA